MDIKSIGRKICGVLLICIGIIAAVYSANALNEPVKSRILPAIPVFLTGGALAVVCIFLGLKIIINKN